MYNAARMFKASDLRVKKVILDGKDITSDCLQFVASPTPGVLQSGAVLLVKRDDAGHIQRDETGEAPEAEWVTGMVEWHE